MNEQELNKKLAEWAGFKFEGDLGYRVENDEYLIPNTNFTQSLDACFKWLVPKMDFLDLIKHDRRDLQGWFATASIKMKTGFVNHKDPTLALCLAIEKLIDKEKADEASNTG